jgi:hypothetical protein
MKSTPTVALDFQKRKTVNIPKRKRRRRKRIKRGAKPHAKSNKQEK